MSSPHPQNPFLHSPSHSAHISIEPDSHPLFLRSTSPSRIPGKPVVIIEAGLGGTSSEWVAVSRLLSPSIRVFSYDRSGYGKSKPLPPSQATQASPPTTKKRCEDLTLLLQKAGVEPPWVAVGHSYGGVLVREFLLMHGRGKVVGMVIVDFPFTLTKLPSSWPTLLGEARYEEVVGLERKRALSDEEWEELKSDDAGNEEMVRQEEAVMGRCMEEVNRRVEEGGELLGDGRLSVLFCDESVDFRTSLKRAEEMGIGSEEAREELRVGLRGKSAVDEESQRKHLSLSRNSRFVRAEGDSRTHNVHLVDPEFVANEIRWVLDGFVE